MIKALADLITDAAEVMAPYTDDSIRPARSWNGKEYAASEPGQFDPAAAKWWGVLSTLGEMLRNQDAPLSQRQLDYLARLLFGGMGSLVDFRITAHGDEAVLANKRLDELTSALHSSIERERSRLRDWP